MSSDRVGRLYDRLCDYESRRTHSAYPIHKRLRFAEDDLDDIYDWIMRSTPIKTGFDILDAGCGVGFGAAKLARSEDRVRVRGISLSETEIARARRYFADDTGDRLRFDLASFDTAMPSSFDVVVAVESLKHSPNLEASLDCLAAALRPGGQLVVVDDYYCGRVESQAARSLARAWHLQELHREEQVTGALGPDFCEVEDLTRHVRVRSAAASRLRGLGLGLAASLPGAAGRIARIFRGGIALDSLYAEGSMRYLAIRYRKPARPSA